MEFTHDELELLRTLLRDAMLEEHAGNLDLDIYVEKGLIVETFNRINKAYLHSCVTRKKVKEATQEG